MLKLIREEKTDAQTAVLDEYDIREISDQIKTYSNLGGEADVQYNEKSGFFETYVYHHHRFTSPRSVENWVRRTFKQLEYELGDYYTFKIIEQGYNQDIEEAYFILSAEPKPQIEEESLKEELITPEPSKEEIPASIDDTPDLKSEPIVPDEVDAKIETIACEEAVNSLMQQAWNFISNVNSVIATLDLNYKGESKGDVIELLNAIVDDSTINIGVIQKVTNIMNIKKVDLLDAGEVKADKILTKEADSE